MGLRTALGLKTRKAAAPLPVDGNFTANWAGCHIENWRHVLQRFARTGADILEVGSFEGRSALVFLSILEDSRITCVDLFDRPGQEERFDSNLRQHAERLKKLKGYSTRVLPRLIADARTYDVIYIDGDHTMSGVVADSVLCWPLLRSGGIVIWDDYRWQKHRPAIERPQKAIDWFLQAFGSELEVLHQDSQVIARKH